MSEELPSINDFIEDKTNLPSVETFTEGALYIHESDVEKKDDNITEVTIPQVIREQPDNTALIVSLIENVRNSIPEVKSYDQELYDIVKLIEQLKNDVEDSKTEKTVLMESNGYDKDVLREELNDIRNSIPTVPEVKYYDEEIKELQEAAKREFDYGEQYKKLTETVLDVRDRANVDHSWIRSTFSNIDDNFDSVTSSLATVKGKLEMEVSDILESMETTAFETKVDRNTLNKKIDDTQKEFSEATEVITSNVVEFKDKIYKELKEASLRIWNINKAYQKDDVKLQEQLDQQYSKLKESIAGVIENGDKKYDKLNRFYDILKEQIIDLPEIKNYDEEIKRVDHSVYSIRNLVTEIDRRLTSKVNKIKLDMKEGLLNIPPNLDNVDPLTPLDQNFATLDDLSNHYRLFMNRIQTQLATLGGGGAVWLWDLDDVNVGTPDGSGYPPIPDGNLLIYDASANTWVGIASTALTPGDTDLQHVLEQDNIAGLGMSVGFITATGMNVSGNVTIGGTLTYEDVKNVDAIGLITARSGIDVTGGSVVVQTGNLSVSGVTTLGVTTVTDLTARNLDVTGIATFGTTSVVIDGNNDLINVGTALTLGSVEGVLTPSLVVSGVSTLGVITGATSLEVGTVYATTSRISGNVIIDGDVSIAGTLTKKDVTEINSVGLITANSGINVVGGAVTVAAGDVYVSGVVTATSFYGDGSGLTGLANTDRITAESLVVLGVTTSFGGIVVDRTSVPNNILTAKLNGVTKAQIVANGNAQFASLTGTGTLNVTGVSTLTTVNATSFIGPLTGSSTLVGGVSSTFLLNYNNFTNTPTNLNQFVNGPGYVTNNVTGDFAVSGNLSIGGTLTYEDVQNVDSVGLITARSGIVIGTGATIDQYGNGDFVGVITASTYYGDGSNLTNIISGVGIQSGSVRVGTGFTDLKFTGAGVSSVVGSGTTVTIDIPATTIRRQVNTATGITTVFTITDGYTAGFIDVYLNGVKLRSGTDFTATNGTTVTMTPAVVNTDVLEFQVYENLTVANSSTTLTGTQGQFLQHNGSEYVGVSSVGIATYINDYHQGYYRYSTNYYTTGVANTVQTLPADEFVLIQPSVRTNKTDFMPQKMLDVNNNNPWVGTGATIGTGQTTFSLAGLDDGSAVIVRIAGQFNPDIDNTNLDFKLEFTTNTATQGTGLTNFSITREQALICNEGADQPYISETLINFYVGSSLSGLTKDTAGSFNITARASDEGDFEMMALTINVVT